MRSFFSSVASKLMRYAPVVYQIAKKHKVSPDTAFIVLATTYNDTDVLPTEEGYRVFFASRDYKLYRIDDKVFTKKQDAEKRRREVAKKLAEAILASGLREASSPVEVYEFLRENNVEGFKIDVADGIDDDPLVRKLFNVKKSHKDISELLSS